MYKKIIAIIALISTILAHAGHETGNGGDAHLSRYLLAQHIAGVTIKSVTVKKLKEIFPKEELFNLVEKKRSKWINEVADIKFIVTNEMLFENGKEKAALNIENSNEVKISKAYFQKYKLSLDEVIVNVMHEAGHKIGIQDHQLLDSIGSTLVNHVYKYSIQKNAWVKFLKADRSIQSGFDRKLKDVALEYLLKGDAVFLAQQLYYLAKFNLNSSNLSQMFRYMAMSKLGLDVKKFYSEYPGGYWDFRELLVKRFVKELSIYSKSISKEASLKFIKYGMAKLKIKGLLYTENVYGFNLIANELNIILRNKNQSVEITFREFMKVIRDKFYLYI